MKNEKWGVDPVWCNFRLFDANSLAANQQLSLLYEKLPCLSRIRHAHALHPSSLSLSFSFSVTLFHSFPCTRAQQTFLPSRSRTTMRHSLSSLTTHFVLLFTNFTPPSFFLSPVNKRVHLFFFFYFRVAWSFVHPWTKKVCVNDRSLNIAAVARLRLRSDHIFLVRCWSNDLAYT